MNGDNQEGRDFTQLQLPLVTLAALRSNFTGRCFPHVEH